MDPLELLRSRNRFEEDLPSGLHITRRLPRIRDCIVAGHVPLPVITALVGRATQNGDAPPASPEEAEHMARFQDELVIRSIVAIEGEPVKLTRDDLQDLRTEDYDYLVELALREQASPKAGSPT